MIQFLDDRGTFSVQGAENYNGLYFPIAGEKGIKSAITPNLCGDSKLNQNAFILEPVSIENLHNNRSSRNFWCVIPGKGAWSAVGQSAEAEFDKFTDRQDESELTAGFMWQRVVRKSKKYPLKATVLSFVPTGHDVEIMYVEIKNVGKEEITFSPVAAIPLYGRSADNIRDHRHVTALLHRISTTDYGVNVKPTLSFDERGHQKNYLTYFVQGMDGEGNRPVSFYPTVELYLGEGRTYTYPGAVADALPGVGAGEAFDGCEAVGGLRFAEAVLQPMESVSYTILLGATENQSDIEAARCAYDTKDKVEKAWRETDAYWQKEVNIHYHTGSKEFDGFLRWVSFQPFLRRIYGCSFLPHHDYGKGGRGWRDLWQDCLALLMMNPSGVRNMIVGNFGGVRMDGTNATIIGTKQGEFIADRNNITRVWMDHGAWPFLTTKLYIDQTGDVAILNQQVPYFKDRQVERGTSVDEAWDDTYGNLQKDVSGKVYQGSILEHMLLQHLCAFYEVGEHNYIRLRGADWNDALDMAPERGESVAFTCAYAGNLKQLAHYIRILRRKFGQQNIELLQEIVELLGSDSYSYEDISKKHSVLKKYVMQCSHNVSGAKIALDTELVAKNLEEKADWMMCTISKNEWITDEDGNGWFNGYYDNSGNAVEGVFEGGNRMMLTGQVFAIMSKTASAQQTEAICKSADKYLYRREAGGYRINTDFKEEKYDMGRMFGFAYGEKENGAVFSHMTVMYANALYQNGFVKEGHKALQTLADSALDFETSKIFPGIPEYFNASGRGLYHYLTGAASWYMLTMVTEVFGVKGEVGNLAIEPKLLLKQFDEKGEAKISLMFAGQNFEVVYENKDAKDYGEYQIKEIVIDGSIKKGCNAAKAMLSREEVLALAGDKHQIRVILN